MKLDGIDTFNKDLKRISREANIDLDKLLVTAATETQGIAIKRIQSLPATGRLYRRGSITHQASAQGEYPMTDRGTLVKNITLEKDGILNYSVGSRKGAPHGFYLEMKSPNKGGRPWLSRAFEEMKIKLNSIIDRTMK